MKFLNLRAPVLLVVASAGGLLLSACQGDKPVPKPKPPRPGGTTPAARSQPARNTGSETDFIPVPYTPPTPTPAPIVTPTPTPTPAPTPIPEPTTEPYTLSAEDGVDADNGQLIERDGSWQFHGAGDLRKEDFVLSASIRQAAIYVRGTNPENKFPHFAVSLYNRETGNMYWAFRETAVTTTGVSRVRSWLNDPIPPGPYQVVVRAIDVGPIGGPPPTDWRQLIFQRLLLYPE